MSDGQSRHQKRRLYGAVRPFTAGATAILLVALNLHVTARAQALPGSPPPAAGTSAGTSSDSVDAYLLGTWHLAQAIGRAACTVGPVTPQLRALTGRDLEWAERGMVAHHACGGSNGRFATVEGINVAADGVDDLRRGLEAVRTDYDRLTAETDCWPLDDEARMRALAAPVHALSSAAAAALCAIASWQTTLPAPTRQAIRRELETARDSAGRIGEAGVRTTLLSAIGEVSAQLDMAKGEDVYQTLAGIFARLRHVLRSPR